MEGWDVWGYEAVGTNCEDQLTVLPGTIRHLKCFGNGLIAIATEQRMDDGKGNKLPIWKNECRNPICKDVKDQQLPLSLTLKLEGAITNIKGATRELRLCQKKYRMKFNTAYSFSCRKGIRELYPELQIAFNELKKLMSKIQTMEKQLFLFSGKGGEKGGEGN